MKKRISFLLICVMVAITMIMPCVADEETTEIVTDVATETVEELVTEEMDEPEAQPEEPSFPVWDEVTKVPDVKEPTAGDAPAVDSEEMVDEAWETFKAKITDTATWTMIGTALVTIVTTIATVASKFKSIASLVHNKADNETVKGAIKDLEQDIKKTYNANHKEVANTLKRYEEALQTTQNNEQKLYAILTLFMTNCKISESAKAEILNILADVKTYGGNALEFVEQAQEAINKEIEEKEKTAVPTPTLDQLLEEDYMELG